MSEKSKIKGYVVRGKCDGGDVFYVGDGDFAHTDAVEEEPMILDSITDALSAQVGMENDHDCTDVRILAVYADGTETRLPTYEEALAELAAIDAAVREGGVEARGPDDTLPARVARLIEDANKVARGADEVDDILERIIDAWRDDEIGAIDGALIEEAEALLGITPEADPLAC